MDKVKLKVKSFFYEQKKEISKSEKIEQMIIALEKSIGIMIGQLNNSAEIKNTLGSIDRTQFLSIFCFNRLPKSDDEKEVIEQKFNWQNFIELFKEYLNKLQYFKKATTIPSKFEDMYYYFFPRDYESSFHFLQFITNLKLRVRKKEILDRYSVDKNALDKMKLVNLAHLLNIFFSKEKK